MKFLHDHTKMTSQSSGWLSNIWSTHHNLLKFCDHEKQQVEQDVWADTEHCLSCQDQQNIKGYLTPKITHPNVNPKLIPRGHYTRKSKRPTDKLKGGKKSNLILLLFLSKDVNYKKNLTKCYSGLHVHICT